MVVEHPQPGRPRASKSWMVALVKGPTPRNQRPAQQRLETFLRPGLSRRRYRCSASNSHCVRVAATLRCSTMVCAFRPALAWLAGLRNDFLES